MSTQPGWQFWIDRGGTFTDVVARRPNGSLVTHKLLSENPQRYEDAALQGIREAMGIADGAPLPGGEIEAVKMGTTVATNALLERKGDRTLLAITRGFADALRIGDQKRPRLFDRHIVLPSQLYERVIEVEERVTALGGVRIALDAAQARRALENAFADGIHSVAIVLMHGYRYPAHEQQLAAIARDVGFTRVSTSHEASRLMKLIGRGDTTVVDAYVSPILRRRVDALARALGPQVRLSFMQSNGGLAAASAFQGKDAILSGPAGGIVGMARAATQAGFDRVIGFDMGGTSTDVSHYAGQYERSYETVIAGVRLRAPMMNIHTIAAGGGSICRFDGARFRVGPESAGADPGPACYRRGGPLTVTDCNVMVGKLQPAFFPAVFGASGTEPLDSSVVIERFEALAAQIERETTRRLTPVEIAHGFLAIAVDNVANAIKQISIARGYDVTTYTLVCFGGAGGQHACLVADALGMKRVLIHPLAGVLSAYGIGLADERLLLQRALESILEPALMPQLERAFGELHAEGHAALVSQGASPGTIRAERRVSLKYKGTDTALEIRFAPELTLRESFEATYRQRFAFIVPDTPLVVESITLELIASPGAPEPNATRVQASPSIGHREPADGREVPHAAADAQPVTRVTAFMTGRTHDTPVFNRDTLGAHTQIVGPAILFDRTSTTVVEPGWQATVNSSGDLILERVEALPARTAAGTDADPVRLEIFNNLFMSIAEQMGVALQSTAYSVNIKERLDFSCALFDPHGALIANAPHMPVHLGSMGESVRSILRARGDTRDGRGIREGDVYALNNPYDGGTHLPDVTVVMPVFDTGGKTILFHVAARGHHADIGGLTPGSMPPDSKTLADEGILIDNFLLVEAGAFREKEFRQLLSQGPVPARNITQNLGDIKAQVAACARGAHELRRIVGEHTREVVLAYMHHVRMNAAESVRRMIGRLENGSFTCESDDGAKISVDIRINPTDRTARISFEGTSAQQPNNFNAPSSITRAATLYVVRSLVDDDIPMNEGCLEPIELIIPKGSMLAPQPPGAVVAGNVETSQLVTDALFAATGQLAACQGTMNNFTFGNETHQYYETISGGSGAGPGFEGTSAVQTHMTNSRLTDPEVLEWRFPVLVESFEIRKNSGGEGRWRGGDGVIRKVRFLEPMTASILSNRRRVAPFGLNGGGAAATGRNYVERANGTMEELPARASVQMNTGDAFVIETPGGGGYGKKLSD
ncbi:MAG: hydantoinase B/oxoprolinase family protein [Gammaproteobacteria bacterium]